MKHQEMNPQDVQPHIRQDETPPPPEESKVKPPFVAPKLVVHGDITELTAFTGSGSV